jgi:hypothetical protein
VSTPEEEALLGEAIGYVDAGELEKGRALLERVLEQNPKNDRAWVWMSGCVEGEMQRRICLEQALRANPNNQAALEGLQLLEGKLVQATDVRPSLLESRLSAIGMSDRPTTERRALDAAPPWSAEATALSPTTPGLVETAEEYGVEEPRARSRGGRILLLVLVVLLLSAVVCALVAVQVLPALLEALPR